VHVIANCRGTGGSGGTFGFFDSQERRDMRDLIEWAGQQPWSNGNVGMIGISYFAGTQMEAAVERPARPSCRSQAHSIFTSRQHTMDL
jgi:putative CocE/NonD family hydrolase